MKILVACDLPATALEQLAALGAEVVARPNLAARELRDALTGVGVLIVQNLRVAPDAIARARDLQMVIHAGPGPGEIAVDDASAAGVFVTHCPEQHAVAVAELTLGLVLALDRRIVENAVASREGRWIRPEVSDARGLAGRTLGVVGWGAVGRLVAARARAFGLRVLAWPPPGVGEGAEEIGVTFCNWPRELARAADIVTVHSFEDEEDRGVLIDEEFLASLSEGAALVHVGRPGAVDAVALAEAIPSRRLRVAVDVFIPEPTTEPSSFRVKLAELPGVICTQHIGPLTEQARAAAAAEVVRIVHDFLVAGEVRNCLNLLERSPATWQLVLRVRDQVGVMASILEAVRADGINAEEIESRVFAGAKAAWCTISLDERPSTEALEAIRALPDVLHLELRAVV